MEFQIRTCEFTPKKKSSWYDGNMDLTGLLCDCGGLALAILRDRGHADVVADAGLQSVNGVLTGRRQNHVLKDGYALAGCHHRDPVTSDGCGVER